MQTLPGSFPRRDKSLAMLPMDQTAVELSTFYAILNSLEAGCWLANSKRALDNLPITPRPALGTASPVQSLKVSAGRVLPEADMDVSVEERHLIHTKPRTLRALAC